MRKIMVFQHVGHEPLGTLDPLLKAAGFRIRYINFGRNPETVPSLENYSGLIILGGPMGVYEASRYPHLKVEMELIEEAFRRDIPVLGICLGSQLIAEVLGGNVRKHSRWELGWHELQITDQGKADPLFQNYQAKEKVFQIHQDTFDIPKTAEHLALSEICEGQAFRYGKKVYGLQFHLEADRPMIERWLARTEHLQIMEEHKMNQKQVHEDTKNHIERSLGLSAQTFSKFIEIFQLPEKPIRLGSSHANIKK